ncbi:hypothetical protein FQN55_006075 [Onygenales sp. PD_40]|nr:hypothetical protein FQN55_006075 [Onygenales sp. PD_40]KAK2770468.1 hypothetical protein FQN53_005527 [Emmonsiellopsis sp. PD_33]KAK2788344.1 hypothetical protein FQN51_002932 [Onygenales sp. PD_10]
MADYASWKVADLKAELKRRGIPQTGLRLKQHFIDRLVEADASAQPEPSAQAPPTNEPEQPPNEVQPPSQDVPETAEKQTEVPEPVAEPAPVAPEPVSRAPAEDIAMKDAGELGAIEQHAAIPEGPSIESKEPTQEVTREEPSREQEAPSEPAEKAAASAPSPKPQKQEPESAPVPSEDKSASPDADDSRKRKRRSQSPPPSPRTAALKKAKAEDGLPRVVLKEGDVEVEVAKVQDTDTEMAGVEKTKVPEEPQPAPEAEPPAIQEPGAAPNEGVQTETTEQTSAEADVERSEESHANKQAAGDARFKSLFPVANGGRARSPSPPKALAEQVEEDRIVSPALHPATTSLYIRNFMRPLQPTSLKKHLASLATPPSSAADPDTILDFFLDSIKTHCLVTFTNISAASRVRSALHGTIWPDERTRKPLWVDFVPEEKVKEWIGIEQDAGNAARGAPRWEVVYDETDRGVTASLQEASSTNHAPPRGRDVNLQLGREPPLGPRATHGPRRDSQAGPPPAAPTRYGGEGFKALDDRFLSTTAKPKLYYLPVPAEVSDKRLDRFADLKRAGPTRRPGGDEMRKYTFEDTDFFVDRGAEYGNRGARRRGGRGGGGGGGGGRWRDRDDRSWRR